MRQIGIIPSGCQLAFGNMVAFNGQYIMYASTLAVYIINPSTFVVEKVLSNNSKTIISIAASPHDDDLVAMVDFEGQVILWKISTEEIIASVSATSRMSLMIQWEPQSSKHCTLMSNGTSIKLYQW